MASYLRSLLRQFISKCQGCFGHEGWNHRCQARISFVPLNEHWWLFFRVDKRSIRLFTCSRSCLSEKLSLCSFSTSLTRRLWYSRFLSRHLTAASLFLSLLFTFFTSSLSVSCIFSSNALIYNFSPIVNGWPVTFDILAPSPWVIRGLLGPFWLNDDRLSHSLRRQRLGSIRQQVAIPSQQSFMCDEPLQADRSFPLKFIKSFTGDTLHWLDIGIVSKPSQRSDEHVAWEGAWLTKQPVDENGSLSRRNEAWSPLHGGSNDWWWYMLTVLAWTVSHESGRLGQMMKEKEREAQWMLTFKQTTRIVNSEWWNVFSRHINQTSAFFLVCSSCSHWYHRFFKYKRGSGSKTRWVSLPPNFSPRLSEESWIMVK